MADKKAFQILLTYILISLIFYWRIIFNTDQGMFIFADFWQLWHNFFHFHTNLDQLFGNLQWSPYEAMGTPFLARLNLAFFEPMHFGLAVLLYLVKPSWELSYYVFELFSITVCVLGGFFFFIYLQASNLKIRPFPAFFGGLVYTYSGYTLTTVNLVSFISAAMWVPLVLIFIDRYFQKYKPRYFLLAAIFYAFIVLSGVPQYTMYFGIFLSAYIGFYHQARLKDWILFLGIFFLGTLGITAIQMLPALELAELSNRQTISSGYKTSFFDSAIAFLDYHLSLEEGYGRTENFIPYYHGIVPAVLSIAALWFYIKFNKNSQLLFWLLTGITSFLLSLGTLTPLYDLVAYIIPQTNSFRNLWKYGYIELIAIATISSMVLNQLLKPGERGTRFREILHKFFKSTPLIFLGYLILIALVVFIFEVNGDESKLLLRFAIFKWTIILVSLFILSKHNFYRKYGVLALLTIMYLMDMRMVANDVSTLNLPHDPKRLFGQNELTRALASDLDRPYRILYMSWFPENYVPHIFGMETANGYVALNIGSSSSLLGEITSSNQKLLGLLNIKYIVSYNKIILGANFNLVKTILVNSKNRKNYFRYDQGSKIVIQPSQDGDKIYIYRVKKYLNRIYMNYQPPVVINKSEDADLITTCVQEISGAEVFDNETGLWKVPFCVDKGSLKAIDWPSRKLASPENEVTIKKYSNHEIEMEVWTSIPGMLIISNNHYPGWDAVVNGEANEIIEVNGGLQGIYLKEGRHDIVMTFKINNFKIYAIISIFSLIGLFILYFWGALTNRF